MITEVGNQSPEKTLLYPPSQWTGAHKKPLLPSPMLCRLRLYTEPPTKSSPAASRAETDAERHPYCPAAVAVVQDQTTTCSAY